MKHPFDNFLRARILQRVSREALHRELDALKLHTGNDFNGHLGRLSAQICASSTRVHTYLRGKARKKPPPKPTLSEIQAVIFDTRLLTDPEDPDVVGAQHLLQHPGAREIVEILLLQNTPPSIIAQELTAQFAFSEDLTSRVTTFSFYFWNVDDMSPGEFGTWLDTVPEDLMPVHRMALYQDVQSVRALLGVTTQVDLMQSADSAVAMALNSMRRMLRKPNAEFSEGAQTWARYFGSLIQASVKARGLAGNAREEGHDILQDLQIELQEHEATSSLPQRADLVQQNEQTSRATAANEKGPPSAGATPRKRGKP